jgi:hypothetical protein
MNFERDIGWESSSCVMDDGHLRKYGRGRSDIWNGSSER